MSRGDIETLRGSIASATGQGSGTAGAASDEAEQPINSANTRLTGQRNALNEEEETASQTSATSATSRTRAQAGNSSSRRIQDPRRNHLASLPILRPSTKIKRLQAPSRVGTRSKAVRAPKMPILTTKPLSAVQMDGRHDYSQVVCSPPMSRSLLDHHPVQDLIHDLIATGPVSPIQRLTQEPKTYQPMTMFRWQTTRTSVDTLKLQLTPSKTSSTAAIQTMTLQALSYLATVDKPS